MGSTAIRGALAFALLALFGPGLLGLPVTPATAAMAICGAAASAACAAAAVVRRRRLARTACWFLLLAACAALTSLFQRAPLLLPLFESVPLHSGTVVMASFFAVVVASICALWEADWDPGP